MHHKRGRPKNRRSGCLMCKRHKVNGNNERAKADRESQRVINEYYDSQHNWMDALLDDLANEPLYGNG